MALLQGGTINSSKARLKSNNLKILIDEDSGDIAIHNFRYGNEKTLIIPLDEMPERYQSFFAGFVLTNR